MLVVSLCLGAFAERVNMMVTGELRTWAFSIDDMDLDSSAEDDYAWFESRIQVDFDSELTDGVSVGVTGEGKGVWGDNPAAITAATSNGEGDVPRAFVKLADMKNTSWSLTLGRQFLNFGRGFLISANEKEVSYDGALLVGDYAPWAVSLVGVELVETLATKDDVALYMIDVTYAEEEVAYTLGGYAIFLDDSSVADYNPTSLGVRGSYDASPALDLQGEITYQIGDSGALDKEALALDLGATYDVDAAWMPQFKLNYLFATGDDNALDGDDKAFDPLGQYNYYGYALSPLLTNIHIINASVAVRPNGSEFWQLMLDYYHYTQDEKAVAAIGNSLLTNSGISVATNGTNDEIGAEVDLSLAYDYTEGVKAMVTLAYFMPGDAYSSDDEALEVRGELLVSF